MKIIITTCPKYKHLIQGFTERYMKYWGDSFEVDVAKEGEPWSDQMIRICDNLKDDYFIRLCEDFWINEPIDRELLFRLSMLNADRISLQSRADGYENCSREESIMGDYKLFRLEKNAEYMCSFEASIYRKEFLLNHLIPGLHIWESEIEMSRKAKDALVYVADKAVVKYKDATRRGKSRVEGLPDIA